MGLRIGRPGDPPFDPDHAIQIADRVWWVGHYIENDIFQCHTYLIENGDQSVLVDPGSRVSFPHTLRKIGEVIPLGHIRYFICHHQDPDITACLPELDPMITRKDALLVTHWRCAVLLKHYNLRFKFWLVDENDWRLDLEGGRRLRFVFTPYAHFPGAICTFDELTGVLFSSDLFGGFTENFSLLATSEGYFEALRPFHEHYMPSRDILSFAISQLDPLPIRAIAPQHGSIIPDHLVRFMMDKVRSLDCGLYMLAQKNTNFLRLSLLNKILRDITNTLVLYRDFQDIATALLGITQRLIPARALSFYAQADDGKALWLAPENRFRGELVNPPETVAKLLGLTRQDWAARHSLNFAASRASEVIEAEVAHPCLLVPLFAPAEGRIHALAILHLADEVKADDDLADVIEQMTLPLQVSVEREVIYRTMDLQRNQFYEQSIHDPLTGLFTRTFMNDTINRQISIHNRDPAAGVAVALVDIDHFKSVNDTYGHDAGDTVLKRLAKVLRQSVRSADLVIRFGGEEFLIVLLDTTTASADQVAENIRAAVEALEIPTSGVVLKKTISIGISEFPTDSDTLWQAVKFADVALYQAKEGGRNRVVRFNTDMWSNKKEY
ncbi:MAG: diguanylate cyclase [Alphaproteobacteria bacterium]|nr:diguanylate cyclase [Alphaproteobacteria bacterium]